MTAAQLNSQFLNSRDKTPETSADELSDEDESEHVLLMHLTKSDCENQRVLTHSEYFESCTCNRADTQCGKNAICRSTRFRTCLECNGLAYLLHSKPSKLIFTDAIDDHERLSKILLAVDVPQLPTTIRIKSGGSLRQFPMAVERFPNLTKLILRKNTIEQMPGSLARLKKLIVLDLAHNKLSEIPPAIFSLRSLETLNLKANKIRFISSAILDLKQLKVLCVSCNPLISPPLSVCEQGIVAIKEAIQRHTRGKSTWHGFDITSSDNCSVSLT